MGTSKWSEASYATYSHNVVTRSSTIGDTTPYTADIAAGKAQPKVHQLLNPFGVTHRESRDSTANPNALPIAVYFDVTGSMGQIPVVLQRKLKTLMSTIIDRGYAADPQVLFGAIGDATCDRAPLQVGQFESDIQMDEDLSRMYLEGCGGGHVTESYELAYYFTARHTASDAWDKRQKKGYLFTIGDEAPYSHVKPHEVAAVCGETPQGPLTTAAIIAECEQRYHCFHLVMDTHTSRGYPVVESTWRDLLGDHVVHVVNPETVAEVVAILIGATEGRIHSTDDAATALRAAGVPEADIAAVLASVEPVLRGITLVD